MVDQIIILPHPGGERLSPGSSPIVPWPSPDGGHARKFLRARGNWVRSNGQSGTSWLEFWCEYEPPTIRELLPPGPRFPQWVHSIAPRPGSPTLNTDPWVFFPGFVWSICRHKSLRALVQAGDIVLFGSAVAGEWVLDTVFVVKERRIQGQAGEFGLAYDRLVLPTIQPPFEPFVGQEFATSAERFSFVPAARADDGPKPFARPSMNTLFSRLRKEDGQPPSPENAQALVACTPLGGIQAFWVELVRQIETEGLVLATVIHHPSTEEQLPQRTSETPPCSPGPPSCTRQPCTRD